MVSYDDLKEKMRIVFDECFKLREEGQKEYAHTRDNALRNFEALAKDLGIPRDKVLWTFLKKHLDGILAYINGHKSQREDVRGRIDDAIVYLVILRAMVDDVDVAKLNQNLTLQEQRDTRMGTIVEKFEQSNGL